MKTSEDMVFVALNARVVALDRYNGEVLWQWAAPQAGGDMTVLADRDRLVVSAGGYIYCPDLATGQERWRNPLTGFGVGVAALATVHSHSAHGNVASAAAQASEAAATTATAAAAAT